MQNYISDPNVELSNLSLDSLPELGALPTSPLEHGTAYKFRIAAINSCGRGEFSEVWTLPTAHCPLFITDHIRNIISSDKSTLKRIKVLKKYLSDGIRSVVYYIRFSILPIVFFSVLVVIIKY